MNIHDVIRTFVVDNFLFGEDSGLTNDSSFLGEGIVDSTGILELVAFLESQWGIRVADDELVPENLDSINKVAAFITRKGDTLIHPGVLAGDPAVSGIPRQAAS